MAGLLSDLSEVLDRSGVAAMLEAKMGKSGPRRQIGPRTVIVGILLAIARRKVAHLVAAYEVLLELPLADKLALGLVEMTEDGPRQATYRQFEHCFSEMLKPIDPSPVPCFRQVAENERAARLYSRRRGVDAKAAALLLGKLTDALLEASVPEAERKRSSLAVDWTDHETWARPREKDDPVPPADPDAAWGHAKRNAPGAKDGPFFGYYAQVAVMVGEEDTEGALELIRRITLNSASYEPAEEMAGLLERTVSSFRVEEVLADSGYSFKTGFAARLRALGIGLVMDLHPFDRGPKGTFEGAVLANGSLYCPSVPDALVELGPLARGATASETAVHDAKCRELEYYRFVRHVACTEDGYERFMCPAAAGKIRCPLVEGSLLLGFEHPSIYRAPSHVPRCCRQKTITVPPSVNAKTRQKLPYPSAAHRRSYARRTAAERAYARLADPAGEGVRRGWCRMFGTAKNTFMYLLAAAVHNVRIMRSREKARHAQPAVPRRTRKGRYKTARPKEPAPARCQLEPG